MYLILVLIWKMFLTIIIAFICICLSYVFMCRNLPSENRLVPTHPGKLPIIGHSLMFGTQDLYQSLVSLGNFGLVSGGVSRVYIGPLLVYVVSDAVDASIVLHKCLDKVFVYRFIEPMVGKMLVAADVPVWKRNRRILDLGFKQHLLDEYLQLFNNQADRLADALAEEVGNGEVDLTEKITRSVLETTCRTTMGTRVDGKDLINDNYVMAINEFLDILTTRFLKPWLLAEFIFNLSGYKKRCSELIEIIFGFSEQLVRLRKAEHLQRLKDKVDFDYRGGKFQCLLDVLLENTVTETESLFTNDELRNLVDNVLLAAYDTTVYELLFLLVCIGSYPEVQEKIYEEISQVLDEGGRVSKGNLSRLVYLDAVIKETLRLYPIATLVARQSAADTKLRNVTIPASSNIVVHILAINKNPEYWGPDAEEFKPERWLSSTTLPDDPTAYASFSPGRRGCIGKSYAMMYLKATLVPIIHKFKLTAEHTKMKLKYIIMIKPVSGHHVKIEARQK